MDAKVSTARGNPTRYRPRGRRRREKMCPRAHGDVPTARSARVARQKLCIFCTPNETVVDFRGGGYFSLVLTRRIIFFRQDIEPRKNRPKIPRKDLRGEMMVSRTRAGSLTNRTDGLRTRKYRIRYLLNSQKEAVNTRIMCLYVSYSYINSSSKRCLESNRYSMANNHVKAALCARTNRLIGA